MSYTEDQAVATEMIKANGMAMTLTREVSGVYNPATGGYTTTTDATTVYGVKLRYSNKDIDGTIVQAGDMRVLLAMENVDFEPSTTDTLTIGSKVWKIVNVKPLEPADITIMYTLQVRQ